MVLYSNDFVHHFDQCPSCRHGDYVHIVHFGRQLNVVLRAEQHYLNENMVCSAQNILIQKPAFVKMLDFRVE